MKVSEGSRLTAAFLAASGSLLDHNSTVSQRVCNRNRLKASRSDGFQDAPEKRRSFGRRCAGGGLFKYAHGLGCQRKGRGDCQRSWFGSGTPSIVVNKA